MAERNAVSIDARGGLARAGGGAALSAAAVRKAFAFIARDYQIETGYKLDFFLKSLNSVVSIVFFFYLSRLVAGNEAPGLAQYGGRYFPFVLIGLAFHRYLQLALRWFADSVRLVQVTGCLEAMLATQTRPAAIVLMSSLYGLISASMQLVLMLAVAAAAFGLDLSRADLWAAALVLVLSLLTFVGFGVISATAIIIFKRGDPVTFLFSAVGVVLGGAYFPLEVMPFWLQKLAWAIPITHSLHALRLTLLEGSSLAAVAGSVIVLAAMGAVLFPASLLMFSLAVRKGRRDGTLAQY